MLAVVEMSLWPSHSWICFMGTPCLSRRLAQECPYGKMRLFLTDEGYRKAMENQERGFIKIQNHAKVHNGYLNYDHKDRDL